MNELAAAVISLNGAKHIGETIASLQDFADVVHVFVDVKTTDNTKKIARQFDVILHDIETPGFVEGAMPTVASRVGTRFLLRLDDDEELVRIPGDAAQQRKVLLQSMIENEVTHIKCRRRWVLPGGAHFIASEPWYPDWQTRFYDLEKGNVFWPDKPHLFPGVHGKYSHVDIFALDHLDFCLTDSSTRRAKVARYAALNPDVKSSEPYYCYEDYEFAVCPRSKLFPAGTDGVR